MKLPFNRKMALIGLLALIFIAVLSCGQLAVDDHGGFFESKVSECGTITSIVSSLASKESLILTGSLLFLATLIVFVQNTAWKGNLHPADPPENLVTFVPKQINIVTSQMQEAFRKGVIHSQIYDIAKVSG